MKEKPKKKDKTQELCSDLTSIETLTDLIYSGYNKCIDDYEAFLPSKEEIERIILDNKDIFIFEDSGVGEGVDYSKLAKAISKRLEAK